MITELGLLNGRFNPVIGELQAIVALFTATGGGPAAHNVADLLVAITGLAGNRANRIGTAGGFDTAVDAFMAEYDRGTGGSPAALIAAQLNPAAGTCVLARAAATEVAEERRSPNVTPFDPAARMQSSQRSVKLTYLKKPADNEPAEAAVAEVTLPSGSAKLQLEAIGKERFDTRFIRNIFFITNVVRILRLKLNRELSQSRNVLVASHASVSAGVTEYGSDPFGPNEVIDSTTLGGLPRFNDRDNFV
jgi:hypothetical protein